jgi:hypothetical protein
MNTRFKYGTVSEAINNLRQKGFDKDFRLEGNYVTCGNEKFDADDLQIAVTYRYEGNTDPGDEATVYGIESNTGLKGILLIADGIYADAPSTKILKKLHQAKNDEFQEGL